MLISKNIQNIVSHILETDERSRDNDAYLVAHIWWNETPKIKSKGDFLEMMAMGKVASYESISRCRRKLQELHPELRGTKYESRHNHQEQVKQELREMDSDARGINYEVNTQLKLK